MGDNSGSLWDDITNWFGGAFGSLSDNLSKAFKTLGGSLTNLGTNIREGLSSLGSFVVDGLIGVLRNILTTLSGLGKFIVDGLSGLLQNILSVLSGIGQFIIDGIIGIFKGAIDSFLWLIDWFINLATWITDLLKSLLVPSNDYFTTKFATMKTKLDSKFLFLEVFRNMMPTNLSDLNSYSIAFINDTTISFDWYLPYQPFIKGIMASVFYLLTLTSILKRIRPVYVTNG